jgi:hypothetical protein
VSSIEQVELIWQDLLPPFPLFNEITVDGRTQQVSVCEDAILRSLVTTPAL